MSPHHRDRRVATVAGLTIAAVGLLASGCGSAEPSSASSTAPSTAPRPSLVEAEPGRHAVGYRELIATGAQQRPMTLRAWYPSTPSSDGQPTAITYRAPNKFDEQITPGEDITSTGAAIADARPDQAGGPYPLVVFSHGYALSPIVYSSLVEDVAAEGYVVLAPEHDETFDGSLTGFWSALIDRPVDVARTIDEAERLTGAGAPLAGLIDVEHVAVVGHSYGGYTALAAGGARYDFAAYEDRCAALPVDDPLRFFCDPIVPEQARMAARVGLDATPSDLWPSAGDPRVDAVISMAGDAYLFDERGLAELDVPIMVMGGTVDDGTPYDWGAGLTYDHVASAEKALVAFPGAGHMLFLDPCEDLPWVQASVYRDGFCTDAVWDARPLDVVTHYATTFLRATLDADPAARAELAGAQPHVAGVEYTTTIRPDGDE